MAHWNYQTATIYKSRPYWDELHTGWLWFDCGCSMGLEWGGEYPRECRTCKGCAWLAVHVESRTVAQYPGGPLMGGHLSEAKMASLLESVEQ